MPFSVPGRGLSGIPRRQHLLLPAKILMRYLVFLLCAITVMAIPVFLLSLGSPPSTEPPRLVVEELDREDLKIERKRNALRTEEG